jgi:hypothetical protein
MLEEVLSIELVEERGQVAGELSAGEGKLTWWCR